MSDTTSPVAKLAGKLPKGNGLTRAVPQLFEQRGALVPFVGLMHIDETGLDADDVQHLKASIARFELCLGPLERDGKDLLARCAEAATSREGQQALFADDADFEAQRAETLGYIYEWCSEQKKPPTPEQLEDRWQSFHGGHYDARLEHGAPAHLREFAISIGAVADSPAPAEDDSDGFGSELDDPDDEQPPCLAVPFQPDSPS